MIKKGLIAVVAIALSALIGGFLGPLLFSKPTEEQLFFSNEQMTKWVQNKVSQHKDQDGIHAVFIHQFSYGCYTWRKMLELINQDDDNYSVCIVLHPSFTEQDAYRARKNLEIDVPMVILDKEYESWWNECEAKGMVVNGMMISINQSNSLSIGICGG